MVRQLRSAHLTPSELSLTCCLVKIGYPPQSLTLIPELPVSSLGLSKGEQLIVNQNGKEQNSGSTPARSTTSASTPGAVLQPSARPPAVQPRTKEPDSIETEGGYLVHRVQHCTAFRRRVTEQVGQVVPDDNSCLFSSVAIVFEQNIGKAQEIRKSALNYCQIKLPLTIRSRGG